MVSERDNHGSHVCTGWEMTYSAEIKFILLVKKKKRSYFWGVGEMGFEQVFYSIVACTWCLNAQ